MPGATAPSAEAGASPTLAFSRSWVSWRTRSSILPCSSLAAWYPPFSRRSPSSRAAAILAAISVRAGPDRYSSSALSWLYASWVSQVTFSLVWVTGAPRRYWEYKASPYPEECSFTDGRNHEPNNSAAEGGGHKPSEIRPRRSAPRIEGDVSRRDSPAARPWCPGPSYGA